MIGLLVFAIIGWAIGITALVMSIRLWDKDEANFESGIWFMTTFAAVGWLIIGMAATYALITGW